MRMRGEVRLQAVKKAGKENNDYVWEKKIDKKKKKERDTARKKKIRKNNKKYNSSENVCVERLKYIL